MAAPHARVTRRGAAARATTGALSVVEAVTRIRGYLVDVADYLVNVR